MPRCSRQAIVASQLPFWQVLWLSVQEHTHHAWHALRVSRFRAERLIVKYWMPLHVCSTVLGISYMLPTERDKFSVLLIRFLLLTSLRANTFQNHIKMFHRTSTKGLFPRFEYRISHSDDTKYEASIKYSASFWIVHHAWSTSEPRSPRASRNLSEAEQSKSPRGL